MDAERGGRPPNRKTVRNRPLIIDDGSRMLACVRKPASILFFLLTIAAAAGLVLWTIWRVDRDGTGSAIRTGFQNADAPPGLLDKAAPDARLRQYSAWQMAMIPEATVFAKPLGPETQAGNEPVHAAADGLVVLVAGSKSGGFQLILAHKEGDGVSQTIYSGLSEVYPAASQLVARGARIGTTEAQRFRFVKRPGSGLDLPDAMGSTEALRGNAAEMPTSPLGKMLAADDAPWTRLEIQNAERLSELKDEPR